MKLTPSDYIEAVQRSLSTTTRNSQPMGPFNERMTASSIAWADTQVAAGGDPHRARAAAEPTLALYTGSDSPEA
ncbi:MAG: hypothetical protein OXS29_15400 [bacterium]|nr:hypothetical protein [bacterium]MDE0286959.1 hypothetical protein [bacterium]MDE0437245.1 hypothetical protein [bacterium]